MGRCVPSVEVGFVSIEIVLPRHFCNRSTICTYIDSPLYVKHEVRVSKHEIEMSKVGKIPIVDFIYIRYIQFSKY